MFSLSQRGSHQQVLMQLTRNRASSLGEGCYLQAGLLVAIFSYKEKRHGEDVKMMIFISCIDSPSELGVLSSPGPPLPVSLFCHL